MRRLVLSFMVIFCWSWQPMAADASTEPLRIFSGGRSTTFPTDPKSTNWVVRVMVEHHKDNRWLDVRCESDEHSTASGRGVVGIERNGIFEERFFFNLPKGIYVCEAILKRGEKSILDHTPEFIVS